MPVFSPTYKLRNETMWLSNFWSELKIEFKSGLDKFFEIIISGLIIISI